MEKLKEIEGLHREAKKPSSSEEPKIGDFLPQRKNKIALEEGTSSCS